MDKITINIDRDRIIDNFEKFIVDINNPIELPLRHIFTPGLYTREISIPAGTLLTSLIHKTEHPFLLSKGKAKVFDNEMKEIEAPYLGITKPNTRRVIYAITDIIWTTFHVTEKTNIENIEKDIIIEYKNNLLNNDQINRFKNIVRGNNKYLNKEAN